MGEYGSGISFGRACMLDKERIIHAFKGELMTGETFDNQGNEHFRYEKASREECLEYILEAYDNAVYQAKMSMDSGRALERLFEEVAGEKTTKHFKRYIALMEEERERYQDYHFESDKPELTVLKGGREIEERT